MGVLKRKAARGALVPHSTTPPRCDRRILCRSGDRKTEPSLQANFRRCLDPAGRLGIELTELLQVSVLLLGQLVDAHRGSQFDSTVSGCLAESNVVSCMRLLAGSKHGAALSFLGQQHQAEGNPHEGQGPAHAQDKTW